VEISLAKVTTAIENPSAISEKKKEVSLKSYGPLQKSNIRKGIKAWASLPNCWAKRPTSLTNKTFSKRKKRFRLQLELKSLETERKEVQNRS